MRDIVAAAVLLTAISASAQLINQAHVNVPFSFAIGGATAPAGNYLVSVSEGHDRVTISNRGATPYVLLTTRGAQLTESRSNLAFRRVGQQWILQEVTVAGITLRVDSGAAEPRLTNAAALSRQRGLSADLIH